MEEKLKSIRWLILDVDGTMTDGGVYLNDHGMETKKFNIKDGAGILLAQQAGIEPVILTGRESGCVRHRAKELGIRYVFQNVRDKKRFLLEFFERQGIQKEEAAYLGDDLNDLASMKLVGTAVCPRDAAKTVRNHCQYVLEARGGEGAVREFVEMILKERNVLQSCMEELWG